MSAPHSRHAAALSIVLALAGCKAKPAASGGTLPAATAKPVAPPPVPVASVAATKPVPKPRGPRAEAKALVRDPKAAPRCGKLAAPLDTTMPLLGDRITLAMPKGTNATPRPWDVMGAPEAEEGETRLMIGGGRSAGKAPGDDAFVVLAEETWQLDPDASTEEADAVTHPGSLDEEALKFLNATTGRGAPDGVDVEPVVVADAGIRAYVARPKKMVLVPGADSALVLAMIVALPDATLQKIGFYVSPGLAAQGPGCAAYAERIAASLAVGKRKLDRSAGTRTLQRISATETLVIDVPDDYAVVHQPGPDFVVHHLYRFRPLSLYPGDLSIAIDSHPDAIVPPEATASEKGTLLGKPITWRGKRDARGGFFVVTEPLQGSPSRFVQVVVRATRQEKFLDEFRQVAERLAIVKSSPPGK